MPTNISGGKLETVPKNNGKIASRRRTHTFIIFVRAKQWLVPLRSMVSLIVTIWHRDFVFIIDSSMRRKPAAPSTVSSVGFIFKRFVPNVTFTQYVVDVVSCSCNDSVTTVGYLLFLLLWSLRVPRLSSHSPLRRFSCLFFVVPILCLVWRAFAVGSSLLGLLPL